MPDPKQPLDDTRFDDAPEGEYDAGRGGTRELGKDVRGHGARDGDAERRAPRQLEDGEVPEDDRRPSRWGGYPEPTD